MPKIFELLGYPVNDTSKTVQESRQRAYCPFISDICDGGGNRYMSDINLNEHPQLKELFPGMEYVPSGVCSIQISDGQPPWIICPRRLLYMGKKANLDILKGVTQTKLLEKCNFPAGTKIGIWTEVKVKFSHIKTEDDFSAFDYTFDYVLMPLGKVNKTKAISDTGLSWKILEKNLYESGHTFAVHRGELFIEDFPVESPMIVEVMTSSTSGGNKKKRSCIPQAFEDCMLGKPHLAPGINYRQVWARMASQLIVKSQAAIAWGGKAIWVLQDLLADYISSSTALDLHKFVSQYTDEVNILAFSYADRYSYLEESKPIFLDHSTLYAGPIRIKKDDCSQQSFQDIVLASICPPRNILIAALSKKAIANRIVI